MARGPTAEEVDAAMLKRVPLALEPLSSHSFDSASIVVPIILQYVTPRSVIDFGCKHGEWLKIFKDHGATRIKGLDLERRLVSLAIDPSDFEAADLTRPIALDARYDLAVCIEVAEHLPAASAEPLVDTLVRAAPVVLFSAATPGQGGFEHVNERPRKYWGELFARHRFIALDCLRPQIWQNPDVAHWYRQNLFLYAGPEAIAGSEVLRREAERKVADDLVLVHKDQIGRPTIAGIDALARRAVRKLIHKQ